MKSLTAVSTAPFKIWNKTQTKRKQQEELYFQRKKFLKELKPDLFAWSAILCFLGTLLVWGIGYE